MHSISVHMYMNSGCVLECRDTPTSDCVTKYLYTYGNNFHFSIYNVLGISFFVCDRLFTEVYRCLEFSCLLACGGGEYMDGYT